MHIYVHRVLHVFCICYFLCLLQAFKARDGSQAAMFDALGWMLSTARQTRATQVISYRLCGTRLAVRVGATDRIAGDSVEGGSVYDISPICVQTLGLFLDS